ncbi:MAG: type II secretion system F family protein [Ardenticatenaceae bacterium]|nr:type II secretion system F family protein [Ardenticatenaceae bacterium]
MKTSSPSSPKRTARSSSKKFKDVSAFDLFYQLTYMSAAAAAGISRSKTFELAAQSQSSVAQYFEAINVLVDELRYDYPEACRAVGEKARSDDVKSFLLRLSDALRSGEPLPAFLAREAEVQGDNYSNAYERDLESLKKWSDAFSSIIVSVALILIINLVSTMIYQMSISLIAGLVVTAVLMGFFGAWVLSRAAPQEVITVASAEGSREQHRTVRFFQIMGPVTAVLTLTLLLLGVARHWVLIIVSLSLLPLGIYSYLTDRTITQKEQEISSFLRSIGGMATSTGTTLKAALAKVDISSFPILRRDVERLNVRLQALVSPVICWQRFGAETGSQLIREAVGIFYEAVRLGGDPERVGFLCSMFASKTAMLRAKRRVVVSTFSWLTLVMHITVAGLMIFVLEIIHNFLALMQEVLTADQADLAAQSLATPIGSLTPEQLQFLDVITIMMVVLLAVISALAIIVSDGGYKFKLVLYLAVLLFMSGISFWVVPPVVARILTV